MFRQIDHVAVHCSSLDESLAFYRDCFEFEALSRHDRPGGGIAYLRLGETILELTEKQGEPMSGMHLALAVDDMDAAVAHLARRGVRQLQAPRAVGAPMPRDTEGTRRAVYCGPDGEMIELRG